MNLNEFYEKRKLYKKEKDVANLEKLYVDFLNNSNKLDYNRNYLEVTYCQATDLFSNLKFTEVQQKLTICLKLMSSLDYSDVFCDVWNLLGLVENSLHNNQLSFYYFQQGIALAKTHNCYRVLSMIYSNLSLLFGETDHEKSIVYLCDAIEYAKKSTSNHLPTYYLNLAIQYKLIKKYDKAFEMLKIAESFENKINQQMIDTIRLDLYHILNDKQKFEETEKIVDEDFNMEGFDYHYWNAYETLCTIYLDYQRFDKLEFYLNKLKKIYEKNPTDNLNYTICKFQISLEEHNNNYKEACNLLRIQNDILTREKESTLKATVESIDSKIKIDELIKEKIEIEKKSKKLKKEAEIDNLSGLFNRNTLNSVEKQLKKKNLSLGVLFIDIDDFKNYNDQYGHLIGDIIIKQLGSLLKSIEEKNIHFYRYGGDEFVGICTNVSEFELERLALKIKTITNSFRPNSSIDQPLTVSIGKYYEKEYCGDFEKALDFADKQLYLDKNHK